MWNRPQNLARVKVKIWTWTEAALNRCDGVIATPPESDPVNFLDKLILVWLLEIAKKKEKKENINIVDFLLG